MSRYFLFLTLLLCASPIFAADIWVDSLDDDLNDSNGNCDLREAILAAEADAVVDNCIAGNGTDRIFFKISGSIGLATTLPIITESLSIIGPGTDLLIIGGIPNSDTFKIDSDDDISVLLADLSIEGGDGAIIYSAISSDTVLELSRVNIDNANSDFFGGAVSSGDGTLILKQVSFKNNTAGEFGGAVFAAGPVEIYESTFWENAADVRGGALYLTGSLIMHRSTISNNTAISAGGGVYFTNPGLVEISSSTIAFNQAIGSFNGVGGGGIYIEGNCSAGMTLKNSVVSENLDLYTPNGDTDNIFDASCVINSLGYNFIGKNEGSEISFPEGNPNANNDYVGTNVVPLGSGLNSVIADEGGPTQVHAPNPGLATLVDQGSCGDDAYDQRGYTNNAGDHRIRNTSLPNADDGCDIGAVELTANPRIIVDLQPTVYLDGPYNGTGMNTDLNMNGHVPALQPYNVAPWSYFGDEESLLPNDMVDWIFVRLRKGGLEDATGLSFVKRRSLVLLSDGQTMNPRTYSEIRGLNPGFYFLEVVHRNHLDVLSSTPIRYEWGNNLNYNFTGASSAYSNGGQAQRVDGPRSRMWAGDGDVNGSTTAFDFVNVFLPANGGPAGYDLSDFNLDGVTTSFDFVLGWLPANGQTVQY